MSSTPILRATGLKRSFSGFVAVNNVDIEVSQNSIHSVIGPNGAGKSTLFNLLTRFLDCDEGQILYAGRDVTRVDPASLARSGMVRSFQISSVFSHLTVFENICIPLQRKYGLSRSFMRSKTALSAMDDEVKELMNQFGLRQFSNVAAGELPYGSKRALELATTFSLNPELVLLDEPMAGLGVEDVSRVSDLIEQQRGRRTIVMVEHNLKVVERLSDKVTVLCRGEKLSEGKYTEVSEDPQVLRAYIGH